MKTDRPSPTEIATAIKHLPKRLIGRTKDSEWSKHLKEYIGSLGEKHGWDICASGCKGRFDNGWLYDLIWYHEDPDTHLAEVYLVLESEWRTPQSDIKYDFEKLLLAKATLKVMVFQGNDRNISGLFNFLERGISAFQKRSADETYILAAFNNSTYAFDVRQFNGNGEPCGSTI